MRFKITLLLASTLLFFSRPAHASDPLSIRLQTGVATQHLFSDGLVLHDKPVEQTAVLAKFPLGFMAGLWHTTGYDVAFQHDGGDELAFGAGWHHRVDEFMFEVGAKQHLNAGPRGSTLIPEFEFAWRILRTRDHALEPYVNLEVPISRGHAANEVSLGVQHYWHLPKGASMMNRLAVQLNAAAHGREAVTLLTYRAMLAWTVLRDDSYSIRIMGPWVRIYVPLSENNSYSFVQTYGLGAELEWHL